VAQSVSPRQAWQDAVWEDPDLTTHERLVALAFAKYAGSGMDSVWIARAELVRITKMSRTKAIASIRTLEAQGWLVETEPSRQHKSTRYRLVQPVRGMPDVPLSSSPHEPLELRGTPQDARGSRGESQGSAGRTRTTNLTTKNHTSAIERAALVDLLRVNGVGDAEGVDRVLAISVGKGSTSSVRRLTQNAAHRAECVTEYLAEQRMKRDRALSAEPWCDECSKPLSLCRASDMKVSLKDRHEFREGARAAS
jgi:hypothetical protein